MVFGARRCRKSGKQRLKKKKNGSVSRREQEQETRLWFKREGVVSKLCCIGAVHEEVGTKEEEAITGPPCVQVKNYN